MMTEKTANREMELIKPIERDAVHKICSGQVVTNLAVAVKELVENAIDAGATIIDIQLKEYGSELISIADNGKGICEENYQTLTLRHYTSKIKEFTDLETVRTLGFRGEALSSLCSLSNLSILTKHVDAENATKITYDSFGKIQEQCIGAREEGTTVYVQNLFHTIPVRRKDFLKNLKRDFNKLCQWLYAYCLVSRGIKFSCTNTVKGTRNKVISTEGALTLRENIISVFTSKQISSLIDVEFVKPDSEMLESFGLKESDVAEANFTFEFLISVITHGNGLSTNNRQFFYINSRPCEPTKIMKLVNSTYKQFNSHQYPFVYLNITIESERVDVNVTPDKRQLFMKDEKYILASLKMSLLEAFKCFPGTYLRQNVALTESFTVESKPKDSKGVKRSLSCLAPNVSITERFKKRSKTEEKLCSFSPKRSTDQLVDIRNFIASTSHKHEEKAVASTETSEETFIDQTLDETISQADRSLDLFLEEAANITGPLEESEDCGETIRKEPETVSEELSIETESKGSTIETEPKESTIETEPKESTIETEPKESTIESKLNLSDNTESPKSDRSLDLFGSLDEDVEFKLDEPSLCNTSRKSVVFDVSLDTIDAALERKQQQKANDHVINVKFRSKIDPSSNKAAEDELSKQISKADFAKMEVIGQFNLGFIITRLENDLFIVDQHASDEKYNFEQLQHQTAFKSQNLVRPKPLQLTAGNEALLLEHEDMFKRVGFKFVTQENPETGQAKVHLSAVPMSDNMVLGEADIDEMLLLMQESAQTVCYPSRIRSMLATKACKKSVTIGKHLAGGQMRKLIDHMGEIEHPWNCPHGRPTMRHLINLDRFDSST